MLSVSIILLYACCNSWDLTVDYRLLLISTTNFNFWLWLGKQCTIKNSVFFITFYLSIKGCAKNRAIFMVIPKFETTIFFWIFYFYIGNWYTSSFILFSLINARRANLRIHINLIFKILFAKHFPVDMLFNQSLHLKFGDVLACLRCSVSLKSL